MLDMFPLPLVLIENESASLHIFEQRYKELVNRVLEEGITFGIPVVAEGGMMPTGAEVKISKLHNTYAGGEMDITVRVISRFKIQDYYNSVSADVASTALIQTLHFNNNENKELNLRLFDLLMEFYNLADSEIPEAIFNTSDIWEYYHKCGMSAAQEYEFALINSTEQRQQFILHHLRETLPVLSQVREMKNRIKLNGHFKKLPQSF